MDMETAAKEIRRDIRNETIDEVLEKISKRANLYFIKCRTDGSETTRISSAYCYTALKRLMKEVRAMKEE